MKIDFEGFLVSTISCLRRFAFVARLQALIELQLVTSEKGSILLIPSISDTKYGDSCCVYTEGCATREFP